MHRRGNLTGLVLASAVLHADMALCLIGIVFLLIFLGVALPAVWSTNPARRRAAATVLTKILKRSSQPLTLNGVLRGHDRHVVGRERAVSGDDREPLASRLGDEQPVERVPVVQRQLSHRQPVPQRDR